MADRLPARPRAPAALVPAAAARLGGLAVLVLVGALQWRRMVDGLPVERVLLWAAVAVLAGATLVAAGRLRRHQEGAMLAATAIALVAAAAVSGLPLELLKPARWDTLADGLVRGIESLGTVWLPYAGTDPWPGRTLQLLGAGLCVLAGLLSFWPRDTGRGYPFIALAALLALVVTPVVSLGGTQSLLLGGVIAAGTVCFLWLERLPLRPGLLGIAALLGLAAAGAVPLAGVADREAAWFDYRGFAEEFGPADPVRFDWTQGYGPIDWPRTRSEVLRVEADEPAYWKLRTLEDFDGFAWRDRRSDQRFANLPRADPTLDLPYGWERRPEWIHELQVSLRRLQGDDVVSAGTTLGVTGSTKRLKSAGEPGMWQGVQEFGRGDSYTVRAYVPRPSAGDLAAATSGRQADELAVRVPLVGGGPPRVRAEAGGRAVSEARVLFRPFEPEGSGDGPVAAYPSVNRTGAGDEALRASAYARTWRLAQRLRARARTPYGYVSLVAARLRDGFSYSERPPVAPPGVAPLEAFLFEGRRGYCQQFASAMALLLRMGGVPARVATGFTPGGYSARKGAWIVRDTDAHAWVEAWFDRYGWVALDPTPSATPARSQIASLTPTGPRDPSLGGGLGTQGTSRGGATRGPQGGLSGDRSAAGNVGPAAAAEADGGIAWWIVALGLLAAAPAGLLVWRSVRWGRRRAGEDGALRLDRAVAELEAALRRSGRPVAPGVTLRQLEQRLGGPPEAAAYLQALRSGRYGPATTVPGRPTAAQRRALRRALAAGGGARARVRALWALPPWRG